MVATLHAATASALAAELRQVRSSGQDRRGMPLERIECVIAALVFVALDLRHTKAVLSADTFPIPQMAHVLHRPGEDLCAAIAGRTDPHSGNLIESICETLESHSDLAAIVNDKIVAAARACDLCEDAFPDFHTELVVTRHVAESHDWFGDFASLRVSASEDRSQPSAPAQKQLTATRSERALELRRNGATLAEIGEDLGVSRERARQILAKLDNAPSAEQVRAKKNATLNAELARVRDEYVTFLRGRPPMTMSEACTALGVDRSRFADMMDETLRPLVLPDPKPSTVKWSQDEVLDSLCEAATLEYPLTAKGYSALLKGRFVQGPSVPRIYQIFGSWTAACEAAGVEAGVRPRTDYSSKWTDDDILDAVRTFLRDADSATFTGYSLWAVDHDDRPSSATVRNRLGRWSAILRLAREADYLERGRRDE